MNGEETSIMFIYVDVLSDSFPTIYNQFKKACKNAGISMVMRYRPSLSFPNTSTYLSGYGVELMIKSTEYKVIDDRLSSTGIITSSLLYSLLALFFFIVGFSPLN